MEVKVSCNSFYSWSRKGIASLSAMHGIASLSQCHALSALKDSFEIRRESNCWACPFYLSMGREINAESQRTRSVVSFVAIPAKSSLRSPRLCVSKRCSNCVASDKSVA